MRYHYNALVLCDLICTSVMVEIRCCMAPQEVDKRPMQVELVYYIWFVCVLQDTGGGVNGGLFGLIGNVVRY